MEMLEVLNSCLGLSVDPFVSFRSKACKVVRFLHNYDKSQSPFLSIFEVKQHEAVQNSSLGRLRTDVWMDSGRTVPMANIATESFVLELSQQVCLQEAKRQAEDAKKATLFGFEVIHGKL